MVGNSRRGGSLSGTIIIRLHNITKIIRHVMYQTGGIYACWLPNQLTLDGVH